MKHLKKVLALVIAATMIMSMGLTAFAATHSIKITQSANDAATHVYGAYQIFKGEVDSNNKLTKIEWGDNVDSSKLGTLASELNAMRDASQSNPKPDFDDLTATSIAAAFAEAIGKLEGSSVDTVGGQAIAESLSKVLTGTPATGTYTTTNSVYEISDLEDGYYLVQDTTAPTITTSSANSGANTRYILQLVKDVEVTEKADAPSVDKTVYDNDDGVSGDYDNNGFGETADHAINESFQFKLVATIPADVDIDKYETYKVVFTDKMSEGVTFEKIDSVQVNDYSPLTTSQYACTAQAGDSGTEWKLTIANLKAFVEGDARKNPITITVIYSAHLNANATVYDTNQTDEDANDNKVKLEYSNNPNASGTGDTGETKEDYVFTFTYKVDNTKYSEEIADSHKLKDAGFTLYKKDGTTEVALIFDSTKQAYRPIASGETKEEMKSQDDGTFNIIGLDAGEYVLKETSVPAGYNPVDDITIKIIAMHKENASTTGADLILDGSEHLANSVVNKSGTVLPTTGGIGTTIFYVIGAIFVLGAGILLVTRRRMNAN